MVQSIPLPFRWLQVSVLEWDLMLHTLRTSSLHYFENDAYLHEGRTLFVRPPRAVADPAGRCIATVCYDHQLALLPAMDSDALDLGLQDMEGGAAGEGLGLGLVRLGLEFGLGENCVRPGAGRMWRAAPRVRDKG